MFGIDEAREGSWQIVQVGHEEGRLLQPGAFDAEPGGTFVVTDAPNGRERLQFFGPAGARLSGFSLPGRMAARITVGGVVLNGVGSVQYTGDSVVMSLPETGSLITQYSLSGRPHRSIGSLRSTGHEADRDLHLALNSGLPLVDPRGGFYFVFQTGVPLLRKYDAAGTLLFERHIEGREIDRLLADQPTTWPRRTTAQGDELPLVKPIVRAAAVDPSGGVWIAFVVPFTYVYDGDGEKARVVQFRGAGILSPTSLSFARDGRLLVTPGCYEFRPCRTLTSERFALWYDGGASPQFPGNDVFPDARTGRYWCRPRRRLLVAGASLCHSEARNQSSRTV